MPTDDWIYSNISQISQSWPTRPVRMGEPQLTHSTAPLGLTRDQTANICLITEKTREFQKNIYFCFIDYAKALTVWKSLNRVQLFATPWTIQAMEFSRPEYWILHQEILPTQESNPGLPLFRWVLYQLSHQGSPRILEWVSLLQQIFPTQKSNQGLPHCILSGLYTYFNS